jgi:TH1 protein
MLPFFTQDLDTAMVDPNTSSSTAGSSSVFRKRRLDVALTISELHQRQRRRFRPSEEQEAPISNGHDQTKKLETGLEQFLRRYSVGTTADEKILDALVPTGLDMQAASEEVGNLLVSYPLSIRALLSNIFKTGAPIADGVRTKCANLIALAILATEKRARAEIGERNIADPDAPDAVTLQSTIKAASKLCEEVATMASFVVTSTGKERGSLVSPAQQLCNIALKCPAVAQGVLMWANDIIKAAEFTSSATYSTFAVSILSLVRIVSLQHPCCRKEAAGIAFTFLKHHTSSEISYKKINDIKEQSLRLLLFLIVHGESPSVLRTLTSLLMQGDAIKMDASLMRYFISGIIDVIRPPFSIPCVRLLGAVLKTPRCIDAVRSKYFGEAKRNRLVALLADFKRALFTTSQGKATSGDVALVAFLIKTYRTS